MAEETTIVIKFEGGKIPIEGEVTIAGFEKLLEAETFSESYSNPRSGTGEGQTGGRTTASDVSMSSHPSKHSNLLKMSMFQNNVIPTVTVSFLKMIGEKTEAYDIRKYTNVYITSYSMSKSGPHDMENWTFKGTVNESSYMIQDPTTHALTEATTATLDLAGAATR